MSILRTTLEQDLYRGQRVRLFACRLALLLLFGRAGRACVAWRRVAECFYRHHLAFFARACTGLIERRFSCYLSLGARIGAGLLMPHPTGVVIGEGAVIGRHCTIYQQVTLGGRQIGDWAANAYPHVGDEVVLFAGAKLLGRITLGNRCTIGANAVVLSDIPSGATAVGAPARIVEKEPRIAPDGATQTKARPA